MSVSDFLIDILNIQSLTLGEGQICDFIEQRCRELPKPLTLTRLRNNLIIKGPHKEASPTLGLVGHLDTVPGESHPARRVEGRIHGLGASDMKAGVAVMYEILRRINLDRCPLNLTWIFYDAEEGLYRDNGLHLLFREHAASLKAIDLALILEPTNLAFHVGALGSIHAEVAFRGTRAHSARPWEGKNAIFESLDFLSALRAREPIEHRFGEVSYREVITPTSMHTGANALNVVPDEVRINLNYRFPPGMHEEAACEALRQCVPQSAVVEIVDRSPSALPPIGNSLFSTLREAWNLPVHPKQAFTDVATFASHGVPAVNFGPGLTAQAHQKDEYVVEADLLRCMKLFEQFLRIE